MNVVLYKCLKERHKKILKPKRDRALTKTPVLLNTVHLPRDSTGHKTEYGKSVSRVPTRLTPKMELMRLRQTQKRVPALYEIVNKS